MRLISITFAVLGMLTATAAFAAPASTFNTRPVLSKPVGGVSTNNSVKPGTLAPLTAQECTDLGGSIAWTGVCKSGSSCMRRGADNKDYEVCISAS